MIMKNSKNLLMKKKENSIDMLLKIMYDVQNTLDMMEFMEQMETKNGELSNKEKFSFPDLYNIWFPRRPCRRGSPRR